MKVPISRLVIGLWLCWSTTASWAGSIDTAFLEQPWPRQRVKEYEVWKYPVRWRQAISAEDGIFAGASFVAPSPLERTWELATDYSDLGARTPGVTSVQWLERTPTRQVIQIDMNVLWKSLRLVFEIEQEPHEAVRFRLRNPIFGEYRGVCLMRAEGLQTHVELSTWLSPATRVPSGLVLSVERMVMLQGIREFLQACEQRVAGQT